MPTRRSASRDNIYGSTFFMATGFHGFHVIVGTIFLIVCLVRAYKGHFTPAAAFRLRGGGLVLAFRRRRLAVPVPLHLRLGRLGRRISLISLRRPSAGRTQESDARTSDPEASAFAGVTPRIASARPLRGLCPRCGNRTLFAGPRHLRAEMPRLRARFRRLQRRRRAGRLPDLHRRRDRRRARHRARARRRAALVGPRPALAAADRDPHRRPAAPRQGPAARARIPAPRPRRAAPGRRMRRLPILPTLVVAAAVATMIALGIWQLRRAEWKERLLAEYAAAASMPALDLDPLLDGRRPRCRRSPSAARSSPAGARDAGAEVARRAQRRGDRAGQVYLVPCRPGADGLAGRLRINAGWAPRPTRPRRLSLDGIVAGRLGAVEEDGPIILTAATAAPPLAPSAPASDRSDPQQPPALRLPMVLLRRRRCGRSTCWRCAAARRRELPPEP